MRSRYTAYVTSNDAYLMATWHPTTRPNSLSFNPEQRWLGLKIKSTNQGGPEDAEGQVEFVARYKIQGKGYRLHERSRFAKIDGRWFYTDGEVNEKGSQHT